MVGCCVEKSLLRDGAGLLDSLPALRSAFSHQLAGFRRQELTAARVLHRCKATGPGSSYNQFSFKLRTMITTIWATAGPFLSHSLAISSPMEWKGKRIGRWLEAQEPKSTSEVRQFGMDLSPAGNDFAYPHFSMQWASGKRGDRPDTVALFASRPSDFSVSGLVKATYLVQIAPYVPPVEDEGVGG